MARRRVSALILCLALPGCLSFTSDLSKATLVGQFEFGSPEVFRRSVTLPPGDAQLIVAVPNHRCNPVFDASIAFTARSAKRVEFSERISLSELTWSYGKDACDAYGYVYVPENQPKRGEMRLQVARNLGPVTVEVDTSQFRRRTGRFALVWFVYGDKVPESKLYGEFAERKPAPAKKGK
jgi:hypothetical protein